MKTLILALALLAAPAVAQQAAPAAVCADNESLMVVRMSKLTAGGSAAGYEAAVKGHQDWYRNNGFSDSIVSRPALNRDGTKSSTDYVSIRVADKRTEVRTGIATNKAWDDYVAMYRANSEIVSEAATCMPKGLIAVK